MQSSRVAGEADLAAFFSWSLC